MGTRALTLFKAFNNLFTEGYLQIVRPLSLLIIVNRTDLAELMALYLSPSLNNSFR